MDKAKLQYFRRIYITAFIFIIATSINAQTPTKCFELESLLADACVPGLGCTGSGSPTCNCEGKNEMVRFKVGPSPIHTSDISFTWPNNSFLGISAANSTTAGHVAVLNSTIISCGYLKEPIGGVLPAGATVLLVTSTDMCNTANSFANLSDTIYIIFQNAGNFQGHFVNYSSSPGLRTTIMKLISTGCSDTATYDRSLLINQNGVTGGSSSLNDGSTVEFSWPGIPSPTYINHGCQAPFVGITSNAGNGGTICAGGMINLSGTVSGTYTNIVWKGGTGIFSNVNSLTTNYTANTSEVDSVILSLGAVGHCNDTVYSHVTVHITQAPTASITASGSTTICQGAYVTLTASGGNTYSWSTGGTNSSIIVSTAGTYTVTTFNSCGSHQATQSVSVTPLPQVTLNNNATTLCVGNSLILWVTGVGNYLWSTGSTSDSITVTTGGNYSVTAHNTCGNANASVAITTLSPPAAIITPGGSTTICQGSSVTLNASGGGTYSWSTGDTGNSIIVSTAGTYTLTSTNSCGNSAANATVTIISPPSPSITPVGSSTICLGDSVVLNASGGSSYTWSTGQTGSSINASTQGTYSVTSGNTCGSGSTSINISVSSVTAQFSNDTYTAAYPLTVNFINSSSTSAVSYLWSFGDNSTSSQFAPSHTFQGSGTYTVTLVATSANGCTDSYALTITVSESASSLDIPNIFTPNGDGDNDLFLVKGVRIKEFECIIYDRWGLKMTDLNAITAVWDGKTQGGVLAAGGTYYYIIKAKGADEKAYDKSGFVQLIR
jgi:gliding motility-associated-like protein